MNATQAVSRVCKRLNKNPLDSTVAARILTHINDTCLEKWNAYQWSFRFRDYPLVLSPVITTGTVTATNGSQTVTASGTPFSTTLHKGAWIQFTADTTQAVYHVVNVVSTSVVTIAPPYQGTTGGSKEYRLCPTDYTLPTEIIDLSDFTVTADGCSLPISFVQVSHQVMAPVMGTGYPDTVQVFNQNIVNSSYTTGTVSGTAGSPTLTGTSTFWLANVQPGDEVLIDGDSNYYTVYSVESDTSLTLYQNLMVAPSGDTYSTYRKFGKVARVTPTVDQSYVVFLRGLRNYAPLINTTDTNELLHRYPHAVIEGAVWREAGSSPDPREDGLYMRSERMWNIAMSEDEQMFPKHNNEPIWDARQGR